MRKNSCAVFSRASVRERLLLKNTKWRQSYCSVGERSWALALLNSPSMSRITMYECILICNSGIDCEKETDACQDSPCSLNRTCIDLSPKEEILLGRGYNCSACPPGYDEIDSSCIGNFLTILSNKYIHPNILFTFINFSDLSELTRMMYMLLKTLHWCFPPFISFNFFTDIDECESVELNDCNASTETCENTEGGYICNCRPGHKNVDGHCTGISNKHKLIMENIFINSQNSYAKDLKWQN